MEWIELPNKKKIRTLTEKKIYKDLRILKKDTNKHTEKKEKMKKRITQENEETTWNPATYQKSHQRYLQLSSL